MSFLRMLYAFCRPTLLSGNSTDLLGAAVYLENCYFMWKCIIMCVKCSTMMLRGVLESRVGSYPLVIVLVNGHIGLGEYLVGFLIKIGY